VAPDVADKILSHQSGTICGVAAVYQRHEFLKNESGPCSSGEIIAHRSGGQQ